MQEILSKLDTTPQISATLMDLWQEYEENVSLEAMFVHDIDKFEMLLQAYEYETVLDQKGKLEEFFSTTTDKFQTDEFRNLVQCLVEMRTKSFQQAP